MKDLLIRFDRVLIEKLRQLFPPCARIALFIVFFWFGFLKILDTSPANSLIEDLLTKTLPWVTAKQFIFGLGLYEMLIGIAFLIPRLERLAIALLIPHMITTIMPLFLLPEIAWQGTFIPTLEGQYIIKNIALIALAIGIGAHLSPWQQKT